MQVKVHYLSTQNNLSNVYEGIKPHTLFFPITVCKQKLVQLQNGKSITVNNSGYTHGRAFCLYFYVTDSTYCHTIQKK